MTQLLIDAQLVLCRTNSNRTRRIWRFIQPGSSIWRWRDRLWTKRRRMLFPLDWAILCVRLASGRVLRSLERGRTFIVRRRSRHRRPRRCFGAMEEGVLLDLSNFPIWRGFHLIPHGFSWISEFRLLTFLAEIKIGLVISIAFLPLCTMNNNIRKNSPLLA